MNTINKVLVFIAVMGFIAMCTMRASEIVIALPMICALMACLGLLFDDYGDKNFRADDKEK